MSLFTYRTICDAVGFGSLRPLIHVIIYFLSVLIFCEYLFYYVVLLQCSWPQTSDTSIKQLKVALVADTHLLGPKRGHWFDKLRREWQMHRSYQTMLTIYNPQAVFFLGDIFDEGLWTDDEEFHKDVSRFRSLFRTPQETRVFVVAGNHDIGFHYHVTPHLNQRFVNVFKSPPVNLHIIDGNIFVLVNSMAMENDGCFLCLPAINRIKRISTAIQCANSIAGSQPLDCEGLPKLPANTRPILLQHFPLFRESDVACEGNDVEPLENRMHPFRESWECLSKNSSDQLLQWLHPRAIFGGHTHHGCLVVHPADIPEWSVPSFSWRNRNNPSFFLVSLTPSTHAVSKCFLPHESTVIRIYVMSFVAFLAWFLYCKCRHCWFPVHSKYR